MKRLLVLAALLVLAVPASATTSRILAPKDWWPVWSPDGRHIAFTRVYANHLELNVVDLTTHRVARIGSNAGRLDPSWSSDGSRLAYSSGGVLYIAAADGSRKTRYLAPRPSYAPAWRPHSSDLAYLTSHGATNTDAWVAGRLWARAAIGVPAWSPDGAQLAVGREDGIYVVTAPGSERKLVGALDPSFIVWSHDGTKLAYVARDGLWAIAVAGGGPTRVGDAVPGSQPSWRADDAYPGRLAYSPVATDEAVGSFARPLCPGHTVLMTDGKALTGSCDIVGTPKADVIEGTPLWGDVILAGAGNDRVHANDRHTDRVNCGPGRDTVWADRTDKLAGCEIVHR